MKQSRIFSVLIIAVIALGLVVAACNTTPAPAPIASQAIGVTPFRGDVEIGGKLLLNGVAQTGAVRSGSASTVVTGTKIEHGTGTTPTAFMLTPAYAPATVFSQTLYPISCNVTSCTVGVSSGSVTTFTTVYWMAQR